MHGTTATERAALRERLGPVGVWWTALGDQPAVVERTAAVELEQLGYGSLWVGEGSSNKEPLAHAGILLAATERLLIGTGIANIWTRDPVAMHAGGQALSEAYPGRFVLGIGVSHASLVTARGHDYGRPLTAMRAYLDGMDGAPYAGPEPADGGPRVLAALRPRMLELAGERTAGAHSYFVTPEHTAAARRRLGREPLLIPEQAVLLEADPVAARARAREHMAFYLAAPNYRNALLELGWSSDDLDGGGSDAIVDAIVAWGDEDAIADRVRAHRDAGADHVLVQPLGATIDDSRATLRRLAGTLLGG